MYVPAVLGDWLQGPYLYALYSNYGYNISTIAAIFMAGYASAVVFGTLISSLGDVWGHRTNVFLYGTYIAVLLYFADDYHFFLWRSTSRMCVHKSSRHMVYTFSFFRSPPPPPLE